MSARVWAIGVVACVCALASAAPVATRDAVAGAAAGAGLGGAAPPDADAGTPVVLGETADSALNAGLEHARAGALGAAVHAFETGHARAPLDREIEDALSLARRQARHARAAAHTSGVLTEGEPAGVQWWRFFRGLPESVSAWALLASAWLSFGALIARRAARRPGLRDGLAVIAGAGLVAGVAAAAIWSGRIATARAVHPAVVVRTDPRGRTAPDELAQPITHADLFEGVVVQTCGARATWRCVELVDGTRVWLDAGDVLPL